MMEQQEPERLCITVPEAAKMLDISKGFAYMMVKQGKLPVIQLGRRKLISKIQLQKFVAGEK